MSTLSTPLFPRGHASLPLDGSLRGPAQVSGRRAPGRGSGVWNGGSRRLLDRRFAPTARLGPRAEARGGEDTAGANPPPAQGHLSVGPSAPDGPVPGPQTPGSCGWHARGSSDGFLLPSPARGARPVDAVAASALAMAKAGGRGTGRCRGEGGALETAASSCHARLTGSLTRCGPRRGVPNRPGRHARASFVWGGGPKGNSHPPVVYLPALST